MTEMLVTIQSASRPSQVAPMTAALGDLEAIWYVPMDQMADYEAEGARVKGVIGEMPMKTAQLNAALDDGFAEGKVVITMDDDFVEAFFIVEEDKNDRYPITLPEVIDRLESDLTASRHYLAGIAGTTNPFFAKLTNLDYGMVTGQLLAHKPNPLRFDEALGMLEDLDYFIAHHIVHNGLVKIRDILPNFHIFGRSAKSDAKYFGGYKHFRTEGLQALTIATIEAKYADLGIEIQNLGLGKSLHKKINFRKLAGQ